MSLKQNVLQLALEYRIQNFQTFLQSWKRNFLYKFSLRKNKLHSSLRYRQEWGHEDTSNRFNQCELHIYRENWLEMKELFS